MKLAILLYFLVVAGVYALDANRNVKQIKADWEGFKAKFGKSYSPSEEPERMKTYLENLKEINSHNELYKRGVVSWVKDVTMFTDLQKEDFKKVLGSGPPPDDDDDDY